MAVAFSDRSSILLASTILEKSELNPSWGWVRISSFYLKYCGVINKMNERRRIGIIPIVTTSPLQPTPQESEERNEHAAF